MMKSEDKTKSTAQSAKDANLRRRNFLLTASLGGVGAVAATVAAHNPVATDPVTAAAPVEKGSGYQLSDHVLHYYRTTRT